MPRRPSVETMMANDEASRAGDMLVAEAVLRTRFGRSGLYDVTVRRDGDVIAEFRGRSHQLGHQLGPVS